MGMKFFNPVTPSSRGTILISKIGLSKDKPEKSLVFGKKSSGGRNNHGRITTRHRGGGHKKKYRVIDFKRNRSDQGMVEKIEYDPNRSGFLALISYKEDDTKSYILAPQGMKPGDVVTAGDDADILPGNCLLLKYIPVGSFVHNVELKPGGGAVYFLYFLITFLYSLSLYTCNTETFTVLSDSALVTTPQKTFLGIFSLSLSSI